MKGKKQNINTKRLKQHWMCKTEARDQPTLVFVGAGKLISPRHTHLLGEEYQGLRSRASSDTSSSTTAPNLHLEPLAC